MTVRARIVGGEQLMDKQEPSPPGKVVSRRGQVGRRGEDLAAEHLTVLGYTIVARNARTRYGEIDIVALDGECLVFVEVKTRRSSKSGAPEESMDARKRARIASLAESYLASLSEEPKSCRIDVVAVELGPDGDARRIELISAD